MSPLIKTQNNCVIFEYDKYIKGFMMKVQVTSKDINVSEHTHAHLQAAKEQFLKYGMDITRANTIIRREKDGVSVEFDLHIAHQQPIVVKQTDKDLDAAIDIAIDRVSKALRRLADKVKDHKGTTSIRDLEVAEEV
jgi:putative sigma-54 modulation protein